LADDDRVKTMRFSQMAALCSVCLALSCVGKEARAANDSEMVQFVYPKVSVQIVLDYYEYLAGKKSVVWRYSDDADVWIEAPEPMPRAAAAELIRKTLLERYGIELNPTGDGKIMATWSSDPKYPPRSEWTEQDQRRLADGEPIESITRRGPKVIASSTIDRKVRLGFLKEDVRAVLDYYGFLMDRREVSVARDLQARVWIAAKDPMPKSAAVELIRRTLLERYGIEVTATGNGKFVAAWSKDPKYPPRTEAAPTEDEIEAFATDRWTIRQMGVSRYWVRVTRAPDDSEIVEILAKSVGE
jgi:hypothetical protein